MWAKIRSKILSINIATGIEIILAEDGRYSVNALTVAMRNGKIFKKEQFIGSQDLGQLLDKMDPAVPVSLSINGKGVLTKSIPANLDVDGSLSDIIPNVDPEDFYHSATRGADTGFVSFTRKTNVNPVLNIFSERKIRVLDLTFNFTSLPVLLPYLSEVKDGKVFTSLFEIKINADKEISGFNQRQAAVNDSDISIEYLINDQYFTPEMIMPFCNAISLMAAGNEIDIPNLPTAISQQRKEFTDYKYFKAALFALLAFIFGSLLMSFLVFGYYFDKNSSAMNDKEFNSALIRQLELRKQQVLSKKSFLDKEGWLGPTKISFYADRIGLFTPGSVTLTELNIFPANSTAFSESARLSFKKDTILISGSTPNAVDVEIFSNDLQKIRSIDKVTLKSYQQKREAEDGAFVIEAILKNE